MKKIETTILLTFFTVLLHAQQNIQLLMPANNTQLQIDYPVFSWTSFQLQQFNQQISYHIKIVELGDNQNEAYAINNNITWYEQELNTTVFQYPVNAPEFQTCTKYAWQVEVYTTTDVINEITLQRQKIKIGQSPIYIFKTNGCSSQNKLSSVSIPYYMVLQKQLNNFVYAISDESLRIKYFEPYNNTTINYKISVSVSAGVQVVTTGALTVENGYNYLEIPTTGLLVGQTYLIEVATPKNDLYKAKFMLLQ